MCSRCLLFPSIRAAACRNKKAKLKCDFVIGLLWWLIHLNILSSRLCSLCLMLQRFSCFFTCLSNNLHESGVNDQRKYIRVCFIHYMNCHESATYIYIGLLHTQLWIFPIWYFHMFRSQYFQKLVYETFQEVDMESKIKECSFFFDGLMLNCTRMRQMCCESMLVLLFICNIADCEIVNIFNIEYIMLSQTNLCSPNIFEI